MDKRHGIVTTRFFRFHTGHACAPDGARLITADPVIAFENVGLRYGLGPEVLQDLSFGLDPGSFHFLLGESGAGKSSLLKLMYLALQPTRGQMSLFGKDVAILPRAQLPALRRRIGVVFQEFRLLDHLSAYDNVALPLRVAGYKETDIERYVVELLNWVGLKDHLRAIPPTLSGGQQQRVAIARAVITRPKLLLADEPTGNVDDRMGLRLVHLFEELNKLGTTVLVATHNQGLVDRLNYPTLRLEDGRLITEEADLSGRVPLESVLPTDHQEPRQRGARRLDDLI